MIRVIVNLRCDSSGRAEHHLRTMTDLSCQSNRLGARRAIDSARGRDNSETHRPSHVDSVIIGPGTSTRGRAWRCSVCSSPGSGMLFPSCTCRPCNLSISFIHTNTVFFILSIFFLRSVLLATSNDLKSYVVVNAHQPLLFGETYSFHVRFLWTWNVFKQKNMFQSL